MQLSLHRNWRSQGVPRFAANLSTMFCEAPFTERFAPTARAGFQAVEFLFPYDYAPEALASLLKDSGVVNVLFNLPPGDWAMRERGLAAVPGREAEFRASVATAIEYARVLRTPQLHVMAGLTPDKS